MIPTIIDIEASGFGRGSYPIEVGLVLPDGESHCYIILPDRNWTFWDDSAEAVHGIPRQQLLGSGRPITEVAQRLNQLLGRSKVYTDAWSYDISWLGKLYDIADTPQLFRLDSLRSLLTEEQAALWHPTKEQVMKELRLNRHRASSDALILRETYKRTCGLTDDW